MDRPALPDLRFALLNDWQRGFPIVDEPFAEIGDACGVDEAAVLDHYRRLLHDGSISRIGGVWGAGAGGVGGLISAGGLTIASASVWEEVMHTAEGRAWFP